MSDNRELFERLGAEFAHKNGLHAPHAIKLFVDFAAIIAAALAEREQMFGNLLAVIHRDGGHYISEHGWKKAEKDAEEIVIGLMQKSEPV